MLPNTQMIQSEYYEALTIFIKLISNYTQSYVKYNKNKTFGKLFYLNTSSTQSNNITAQYIKYSALIVIKHNNDYNISLHTL